MSLFPAGTDVTSESPPLRIRTPIGDLIVSVETSTESLGRDRCDVVRELPSGAHVYASRNRQIEVEILQVVMRNLPDRGVLDGCEAAMVRLQAVESIESLSITCRWETIPTGTSFGPESGECLDAQSWESSSTNVTIGTQDGDALGRRVERGDGLPTRLMFDFDSVTYLDDGLAVAIPALARSEFCQVHFVVAWSPPQKVGDIATWFAVDCEPEIILKQAGL